MATRTCPASDDRRRRPAASPSPRSAAGTKFKGVNVNLLTFNGPQVAEPLQRRAPDWEELTGGHVNVVAVGFQTIYDKALLDASTGTNSFDAYVFDPQWLGDFVGPGYLGPHGSGRRTTRSSSGTTSARSSATSTPRTTGKVYTIPLDGDFHMVYYRSDILRRTAQAAGDLGRVPRDRPEVQRPGPQRRRRAGLRLVHRQEEGRPELLVDHLDRRRAAPEQGTEQGAFFDTTTMEPAVRNNEAMAKALETYKKTIEFGPPDEINMDVGDTRGLFTTGRCALSMDWGDIGTLALGDVAEDKTGAVITPGWKEVLDRATGKLVPCDATTCPNAVDGVNYAPFASFGGWSGAINAAQPRRRSRTRPTRSCRT